MREQLNSNPLVQVAVIGVLLVGAGFFLLTTMGGRGEEETESASTESTTATATTPDGSASVTATVTGTPESTAAPSSVPPLPNAAAPAPPQDVLEAYEANRTVVLLFVREGGIDDRKVRDAVASLGSLPDAAVFVVPAGKISRYAAITQGVAVDRVPALVVVRPKNVGGDIPAASVSYGFQSPESVVQAVVDAGYRGRTLDYHP